MVYYVQTEKRIGLAILVARAFKPKASRMHIFPKLAASMRLYIKTTASQTEEEEEQTEGRKTAIRLQQTEMASFTA